MPIPGYSWSGSSPTSRAQPTWDFLQEASLIPPLEGTMLPLHVLPCGWSPRPHWTEHAWTTLSCSELLGLAGPRDFGQLGQFQRFQDLWEWAQRAPHEKESWPQARERSCKSSLHPPVISGRLSFWLTNISLHQDTWPVLRVSISAQTMFSTNGSYSSHLLTSKDLGSYATHTQGHTLGQGFPTLILVPGLLGTQSHSRSWVAGEPPKLYSRSPSLVWTLELHLLSDQRQH